MCHLCAGIQIRFSFHKFTQILNISKILEMSIGNTSFPSVDTPRYRMQILILISC